jgi:cytochrome c oxidase subunit 3
MLISSLSMQMAVKAFGDRQMRKYRQLLSATTILGILFIVLQWIGFTQIWDNGITLSGSGAGQFLYVIAGLHALHVLAGVIALIVMFFRAFSARTRSYNPVPVQIMGTYWHFVDILWIYLFVFFLWIQ